MKHNVRQLHNRGRGGKLATDGRFVESNLTAHLKTLKPKKKEATPDVKTPANSGVAAGDPITLLIAKNPEMNASTFYNLMKSEGFVISAPAVSSKNEQVEADTAGSFPQALRPGVKKESKAVGFKTRIFLESAQPITDNKGGTTRYKVVMLEEGMGNFGASAYYSKEALISAIPIFEGKKIYADHPAESEAEERPERSVRDILGHFENVHVSESAGGGQQWLCGDLVVMAGTSYQWARELMEHAVAYAKKFPDKEFVGLSINASGDSEEIGIQEALTRGIPEGAMAKITEARSQGIDKLVYVSKFNEAVSCDLVTEAGAGGKILSLIESAKASEGGPGSGPQGGSGSKAIDDRKAASDKAANEKRYAKIYSKKSLENQITKLMGTTGDKNMEAQKDNEEGGPGSGPQGGGGGSSGKPSKGSSEWRSQKRHDQWMKDKPKRDAEIKSQKHGAAVKAGITSKAVNIQKSKDLAHTKAIKKANGIESHIQSLMKKSEDKMLTDKEKQEAADKAKQEADAKAKESMPAKGDEQGAGEDDAAGDDMSLIKKMMKKHGAAADQEEPSDEEAAIVKEAYEAHKEMGLETEAAEAEACKYLKASKHMAEAREAKESAAKEASAGSEGSEDDKKNESSEPAQKESSVKESAAGKKGYVKRIEEENAKMAAELSVLRESNKKISLENHKEKVCTEAQFDGDLKKQFKAMESVKSAKSADEVDKCLATFIEVRKTMRKQIAESGLDTTSLFIESEKTSMNSEGSEGSGLNFDSMKLED